MKTTTDSIVIGTRVSLAMRRQLRIVAASQDTNVGSLLRREVERVLATHQRQQAPDAPEANR